jgi:hypothetical protein
MDLLFVVLKLLWLGGVLIWSAVVLTLLTLAWVPLAGLMQVLARLRRRRKPPQP